MHAVSTGTFRTGVRGALAIPLFHSPPLDTVVSHAHAGFRFKEDCTASSRFYPFPVDAITSISKTMSF